MRRDHVRTGIRGVSLFRGTLSLVNLILSADRSEVDEIGRTDPVGVPRGGGRVDG